MRCSSLSLQGKRDNNEDAVFTRMQEGYLPVAAVSDGMGGHAAGEVASGICVSAMEEVSRTPSADAQDMLIAAIDKANQQVLSAAWADPLKAGMGATLVAAVFYPDHFITANVGDSRLYLLSGDNLKQITQDHSYVQELVRLGILSPEKAKTHPRRNMITRCVGSDSCEADLFYTRWQQGDRVLLCSDGLSGPLSNLHIAARMREIKDLDILCQQLAEDALRSGSTDNITLAIVENQGGEQA